MVEYIEKKDDLDRLVKGRNTPQKVVLRANIVKMMRVGVPKKRIAKALNISRTTVYLWVERYVQGGVAALI